ncbi:NUMOD3 domain-containing DNA-binding protein [Bacillus stercoris]|nr:NUMOD3 domain-containing DNA-binding protein [Bacillus stercoris]
MTSGVYKITNIVTGKYYIGSSYNCEERWKGHLKGLRNSKHVNNHLQHAFDKYGIDNFTFEIIHALPVDEARDKEQWYIDNFYDEMHNISRTAYDGGDLISYHPRKDEIVAQMTESVRQRYKNMTDEDKEKQWGYIQEKGNPMQGRKHTDESRRKMSESSKGIPSANKGKKVHSPENIALFSKLASERTGEKNPFYGRQHSEELKQMLSEKFKGRIPANARPVMIDGVEYISATEAARQLGVVPATILHRIKSNNAKYVGYCYK